MPCTLSTFSTALQTSQPSFATPGALPPTLLNAFLRGTSSLLHLLRACLHVALVVAFRLLTPKPRPTPSQLAGFVISFTFPHCTGYVSGYSMRESSLSAMRLNIWCLANPKEISFPKQFLRNSKLLPLHQRNHFPYHWQKGQVAIGGPYQHTKAQAGFQTPSGSQVPVAESMLFSSLLAYLSSYLKFPRAWELPSPSYYFLLILATLSLMSLGPFLVLFPLLPDTPGCFPPYIYNKTFP